MKKVLIASDSFKGTLSSRDIIDIASKLVKKSYNADIVLDCQLLGDGGEGTLNCLHSLKGGEVLSIPTVDAEGHETVSPLLLFENGESAFIEVASIVGLPLLKNDVNPLDRTTKGIAPLVEKALSAGVKRVYVGLGGSSTNDLGMGMLQGLGVSFVTGKVLGIKDALGVKSIDASGFKGKIEGTEFICLTDVRSPLLGEKGATYVYGRQKGYGPYLDFLEERMAYLGKLYEKEMGSSFITSPGSGAAGGLGGAFSCFFKAKLESGIDTILAWCDFKRRAKEADLIITGEGRFDEQSLNGKLISGVLKLCPKDKLALVVGKSKIKQSGLRIYQTSKEGKNYDEIKQFAKEDYEAALNRVFGQLLR